MRYIISLSATLAVFWLINSGHYNLLMLILGFGSVVFTVWLAYRMKLIDDESQPTHMLFKAPPFYVWLYKEIVLSNITVVKHIILGKNSISPTVAVIKTNAKTDLGKTILANSITLTPGTVAIELEDNEVTVHALVVEDLEALKQGEMDRRVSQVERT